MNDNFYFVKKDNFNKIKNKKESCRKKFAPPLNQFNKLNAFYDFERTKHV